MTHTKGLIVLRCECGHGRRLHRWTNPVRGECTDERCACIGFNSGEYVAAPPAQIEVPEAVA